MAKNSILEEALLEAKQLEEAVKSNAKEILASTMKQEIEELVKESLHEDVDDLEISDEEEVSDEEGLDVEDVEDIDIDDIDLDLDADEEPDSEEEMVSIGMVDDFEDTLDLTSASDDEVMKVFKAMGSDDGVIVTQDDDTISIEDTDAGTEYRVELSEGDDLDDLDEYDEYDDEGLETGDLDVMESEEWDDTIEDMDDEELAEEPIYEIEIDEDDEQPYGGNKGDESRSRRDYSERQKYGGNKGDESMSRRDYAEMYGGNKGDESRSRRDYEESEEVAPKLNLPRSKSGGNKGDMSRSRRDYDEASRTAGFGSKKGRGLRKAITNNRNLTFNEAKQLNQRVKKQGAILESLKLENQNYKNKNKDYRKALTMFRDKINEVAVFNANLAYSTKLFTEHTTSKQEKINVLRRFDSVETLNESKGLYKQLNNELSVKTKSITSSIQKTISKSPKKGSSTNLIESRTYVNPQIARMKDIMGKL
tara:strand:+ start:2006 stop:3439 length:1434 start_codon:yes stop_codon:yes gene_type:complete